MTRITPGIDIAGKVVALAVAAGVIGFLCLSAVILINKVEKLGPGEAFEIHLRLADEGRIDEAMVFMSEDCQGTYTAEVLAEAAEIVEKMGTTMAAFFEVAHVFRGGDEAMLRVRIPMGTTYQLLVKEGGEWRIRCTPP